MKMEIISFEDKQPKRGKIICFSESNATANFYLLDNKGYVWGTFLGSDEWEYACTHDELQQYGHYSHRARIGDIFDIDFDIPKDE